jgi:DNA-binding transcriptional ArsR family regulator
MTPSSSELISAVSHPLRRRILSAYLEGGVECASAAELAKTLDQRVGQVAYHLKTLAKSEILRPVPDYRWALGVEEEWLRLVLAVWTEAELAG